MILSRPFHVSVYVSLALSIIAVGISVVDLMPEVGILTLISLMALGTAFYLEGRRQLTLSQANFVGLILMGLAGLWLVSRLISGAKSDSPLSQLGWPTGFLPYFGPILIVLIPAKMFRPKHQGDYWTMNGLSLLSVALAGAMADGTEFFILLPFWAIAFIWSLGTFYLRRAQGGPAMGTAVGHGGLGWRWRLLKESFVWLIFATIIVIPIYVITPRGNTPWELGEAARGKMATGLSEGTLDLNRVGTLSEVQDVVYQITFKDAQGKLANDLPLDTRFRGYTLQVYTDGKWFPASQRVFSVPDKESPVRYGTREPAKAGVPYQEVLPYLGEQARYLEFTTTKKSKSSGFIIADPVVWVPNERSPIAFRGNSGNYGSLLYLPDGYFFSRLEDLSNFVQVWKIPDGSGFGQSFALLRPGEWPSLVNLPIGMRRIAEFTDNLVAKFVEKGQLPKEVLSTRHPITRFLMAPYHEMVARALEDYLSNSGEFAYSFDLKRADRKIDPTEDFLFNVKQGHCQRFATTLAIMLRTQGIPCQLVLGYRGVESVGEGNYVIRESHAHAWVEVLIARKDPKRPNELTFAWLTLDPTPVSEASGNWLEDVKRGTASFLRQYILGFDNKARQRTAQAITESTREALTSVEEINWPILLLGVAAGLGIVLILLKKRRQIMGSIFPLADPQSIQLKRFLKLCSRFGLKMQAGETPQEFAQRVSQHLSSQPKFLPLATLPEKIIQAYYLNRFSEPKNETQRNQTIDSLLDQFDEQTQNLRQLNS
ncbi:MAG: DUF3488 and transglutaminase-like domain-containing protein [Gemmataceae bacterium]|jgi:hypothetical protein|nr:DUF3488 and transglutaminase-like domain-containing protein [Gemmataceae bacterium]